VISFGGRTGKSTLKRYGMLITDMWITFPSKMWIFLHPHVISGCVIGYLAGLVLRVVRMVSDRLNSTRATRKPDNFQLLVEVVRFLVNYLGICSWECGA
jgi:hypothetical protein